MTGLFDDLDPNVDKAVTRVFTTYTSWYMMLRKEVHTEATVEELNQAGKLLILSLTCFVSVSGPLNEVTTHCIVCSFMCG